MGTLYSNFVLENKLESVLATKLDLLNYLTPDYSLQAAPGMIKKVHVYKPTGSVEDLTVGNGNTQSIDAGFIEKEYTVGVTQGRFPYYDEQAMTDPAFVDAGIKCSVIPDHASVKYLVRAPKVSDIRAIRDLFERTAEACCRLVGTTYEIWNNEPGNMDVVTNYYLLA